MIAFIGVLMIIGAFACAPELGLLLIIIGALWFFIGFWWTVAILALPFVVVSAFAYVRARRDVSRWEKVTPVGEENLPSAARAAEFGE